MPNWTENTLRFEGPADQLDAIENILVGRQGPLDFNSLVPMPSILTRVISPVRKGDNGRFMLSEEGSDFEMLKHVEATSEEQAEIDGCSQNNWYDFANENWGTKWNAVDPHVKREIGDGTQALVYKFNTAWDAPRVFYARLKERVETDYPKVTIEAMANHEDGGFEYVM